MKEKNVLIVEPKGATANVFDRYPLPLLGGPILGTMAHQAGYNVKIINENTSRVTDEELAWADVLAESCLTQTVNAGKALAKRYKRLRADAGLESKSVIGGIHASMIPEDVAPYFDHVVVGEGESVFLEILNGDITDHIVRAERAVGYPEGPIPDLSLIKGWKPTDILPVNTSKGCHHDCSFCCVTGMDGRKYRTLELERVIEEASRYDPRFVFFVDNHFVARPKRTEGLLDMMISYGFDREWTAQTRVGITKDAQLIAKMAKAGCDAVYVGVESANQATLDAMNKRQTVADTEHAIKVFHDNGIKVHGMSIIGSDTDDVGEFDRLSDFYNETGIDYAQFAILTPFPELNRDKIYNRLQNEERILHDDWSLYDAQHVVFQPKNMSVWELQLGMIKCYSDFYSIPQAAKVAGRAIHSSARSVANTMFESALDTTRRLLHGAEVDLIAPARELIGQGKELYDQLSPAVIRVAGKHILEKWLDANREYLHELSSQRI